VGLGAPPQVKTLQAKVADYEGQVSSLRANTGQLEANVAELQGLLAQTGDAGLNAQYQEARRMVSALNQDIYFLREKEAEVGHV
jgi:prefoldin subunit 5